MKTDQIFPEKGVSGSDLSARIQAFKSNDARWDQGKVFGFVYHPGNHYSKLSEQYLNAFLYESTLNPSTFPSLKEFETNVTRMAVELMHGNHQTAGNITSGGSESIFLALKVARDSADEKDTGNNLREVVLPETTHPAFLKACHYLGLKAVVVPVGVDKKADVNAIEEAINSKTILLACSAPCFPYGVVDPVSEIGRIARKHKLFFHVDACMGGFMLPFLEDIGYPVPRFDFRVPGVTSISLDAHKYGYSPKGVSIVLYKNRKLRRKQFFVHADWSGGIFASTTFMGTKSGGPLAGCWAVMNSLGREGYQTIARQVMKTTTQLRNGIEAHEDLHIIGSPDMSVMAFTSHKGNIFNIGDALSAKGWHLDRLQFPDALHLTVTQLNIGKEDEFLIDLDEVMKNETSLDQEYRAQNKSISIARALTTILPGPSVEMLARKAGKLNKKPGSKIKIPQAALYGISANLGNRKNVSKLVLNLLDGMYQ
jgi:sphinganine-1-phosphate aldolase